MKINTNHAVNLLIDAYRGDSVAHRELSDMVDEPCLEWESECIGFGYTFERLMSAKTLCEKPDLTKPLCEVLKVLLASPPEGQTGGPGSFFLKTGARFIEIYASHGEALGFQAEACEVFGLLQALFNKHDPSITDYNVSAMTDFVRLNLEAMRPQDLQPFLEYGALYTHKHQEDYQQILLKKFVIYEPGQDGEFPILPMNQALLSVYIGALGRAAYRVTDGDHLPEQPFAQSLLELSDQLSRLANADCRIPGCQLADLHLVSQTMTAMSKAYTLTDSSADRKRYENGISALVKLTLKAPETKLTVLGSAYAKTAYTKQVLSSGVPALIEQMIHAAKDRPTTASPIIESSAIRFNRQVYLELAFRAAKAVDLSSDEGKRRLQTLGDLARDGLRVKEDFAPLGKAQKLWLTMHSDDELTKMKLLETHPELRKATFVHDLGV